MNNLLGKSLRSRLTILYGLLLTWLWHFMPVVAVLTSILSLDTVAFLPCAFLSARFRTPQRGSPDGSISGRFTKQGLTNLRTI
jgi:hypothetical protein